MIFFLRACPGDTWIELNAFNSHEPIVILVQRGLGNLWDNTFLLNG